ncbi:MAG: hypothetical protein JWO38_1496 [Gemmataceae bacterium]|nr:hypothetical protein [Gemmataceae bacterium]
MRAFIPPLLAAAALAMAAVAAPPEPRPPAPGRFPAASDDGAWAKLPPRTQTNPPLPEWARVLAGPLPKTTARMLELDYLHRVENPLGPVLAAKLRWVVADTLGSKYGISTANGDLIRAGLTLPGGRYTLPRPADLPRDEAAALAFARQLTAAGYTITDAEFAALLRHYGPEKVTAIVHTVAYANFHTRIVLGLGADGAGPPARPADAPPPAVRFDPDAGAKVAAPARPAWAGLKAATGDDPAVRVDWSKAGADDLTLSLDKQKGRDLRIPLPDPARFEGLAPREKDQAGRILWNTVSSGYQPAMTRAWFACLSAFYEEAKVDRVFTNSMFWVVTRTNDCFY